MFGSGNATKNDMKAAVKEIQKELKTAGIKIHDSSKQASDAVETLAKFPYLRPSMGVMQGSGSKFLKLEGTVQMYYQNQGYYVPLAVFLRADHPQNPPVCIVTPTPDMMIKPNHNHVDVQGVVYLPYLHTWNASGSSVIEMVNALSAVFQREPFIFKRPAQPPAAATQSAAATPPYRAPGGAEGATKVAAAEQPVYAKGGRGPSSAAGAEGGGTPASKPPARPVPPPPPLSLKGLDLNKEARQRAGQNDNLDEVLEDAFRCPISMEVMTDPVFATDGHTYERTEIERWLKSHTTSPLTNEVLPGKDLVPNHNLRSQIREYRDRFDK